MAPFRILVIYDGKPGHLSQPLGLAQLVKNQCHGEFIIETWAAKPKWKILNRPMRILSQYVSRAGAKMMLLAYQHKGLPQKPDLIISFGGNVVALNVVLSRYWQVKNIAIGKCYHIPEKHFALNLTAFGRPDRQNSVASKVVLCKTDREQCYRAGRPLRNEFPAVPLWGLFIGGEGSGYHYTNSDWHQLGQGLRQLASARNIRWLVSTSRRTSAEGVNILKQYIDDTNCQSVIWYGQQNQQSLSAFLGAADRVFCTEDSTSMLSEAVAMDKPVVGLRPATVIYKKVHSTYMNYLESKRLIERLPIAEMVQYQIKPWSPVKSYDGHLRDIFLDIIKVGNLSSIADLDKSVDSLLPIGVQEQEVA